MDESRDCDLTCKAAFEVDDPVDNVDCYFIWLAHHFGEGLFSVRALVENMGGSGPMGPPGTPGSGTGGTGLGGFPGFGGTPKGPKGPKGFPNN